MYYFLLDDEFMPEPTTQSWQENSEIFLRKWQFPNCCGSIDGKHIRIKCPAKSGSAYYNYKNFFSVVLFAIADANYLFQAVDIGSCGSESDGGILYRSPINQIITDDTTTLPASKKLANTNHLLPYVILADDGFGLKTRLMRPYAGKFLDKPERIFNYRLSRARLVVENAFGILAARWRIFHRTIECNVDLAKLIVKTTTVLHNFLMTKQDLNSLTGDRPTSNGIQPGNWREVVQGDTCFRDIRRQGSNNYTKDAEKVRDTFKEYFLSEHGEVSWQNAHVEKGYR